MNLNGLNEEASIEDEGTFHISINFYLLLICTNYFDTSIEITFRSPTKCTFKLYRCHVYSRQRHQRNRVKRYFLKGYIQ